MEALRVFSRAEIGAAAWDQFVMEHGGWFWQTSCWIDYALDYGHHIDFRQSFDDQSFAVVDTWAGRLVAVVPLVRSRDSVGKGRYDEQASPVVSDAMAWRTVAGAMVGSLGEGRAVDIRTACAGGWTPEPVWPWRTGRFDTYVVNLRKEVDDLKANLRGSYKNLVNRSVKRRRTFVTHARWAVYEAQRIHRESAGRVTRPQSTWDRMADWADAGYVHVALDGNGAGFALAIRWFGHAYYASGATLEKDVAHGLQWALMLALREKNVATYEIGWAERDGDSEKQRNIAKFKAGFGGAALPIWTTTVGKG